MNKTLAILFFLGFLTLSSVFGGNNLLSCEFRTSCTSNETVMLYANKNFNDALGKILSSNVAIIQDSNYNQNLCCKVNPSISGRELGDLEVNLISTSLDCPQNSEDLIYLTNNTNARVAIKSNISDFTDYSYKMCVKTPNDFSRLNLLVRGEDLSLSGYSCLFRINNLSNGVISDCNANFNGQKKYSHTVWAKLIEDIDSLKCNLDCTSKLDGRVYEACGAKISECFRVPHECDGSIAGSYVKIGNYEFQCSEPWTNFRSLAFTEYALDVKSVDDRCSNLIQRKYSVMLNNEPITMSVYICGD